jgi:RHS repeat-associated protein
VVVTVSSVGSNGVNFTVSSGGGSDTSGVYYYFSDQVGTARVITDANGNVCYDGDLYPYGGERAYTDVCDSNYKFTGKERDNESGLDNFGARYDSWQYGRFMTPDWSAKPQGVPYASLGNPQSLNLYSYVMNNPLTDRDLDGHSCMFGLVGSSCHQAGSSSSEMAAEQQQNTQTVVAQAATDTAVGTAKELANSVIDLSNTINQAVDAGLSTFTSFQFGQTADFQSSTPGESSAMAGTSLALLAVPIGGEGEAVSVYMNAEKSYVGITNNLARRAAEHGQELTEVVGGLSRTQAKGVEQAIIEQKGLARNGGTLLNRINSIAQKNDIYREAVQYGRNVLKSMGF